MGAAWNPEEKFVCTGVCTERVVLWTPMSEASWEALFLTLGLKNVLDFLKQSYHGQRHSSFYVSPLTSV